MFEFLKRKRRAPKKARTNSIDELANRLQSDGKADTLEDALRELDPNSLSGAERESWYHLWGITAFRRGDRVEAFARFVAARAAIPESSQIAFSLAQEHEYRGEPNQMFELFDDHRFPTIPASYAFAQARYAYLWNDFDRGLRHVEPILQAQFNFKIADDMLLHMRGMPFFSQTWGYLAAFYELKGDLGLAVQLTHDAKHKLIDYDVSEHERLLTAVRTSDYSQFAAEPRRGTAYERTRAAVLLAQHLPTPEESHRALDDVQLNDDDFPWLADILLLERAEIAHRHSLSAEEDLLERFLGRQSLLFEPDHAFNFRLRPYQETLKERYQRSRRSAG